MASEEQYLDELLKAMENTNSRTMEETMRELNKGTEDEPAQIGEAAVTEHMAPDATEYMDAEPEAEDVAEPEKIEVEPMEEPAFGSIEPENEASADQPEATTSEQGDDLEELLQSVTGMEETENGNDGIVSDLADIHAMLKMAEQNSVEDGTAEEMNALLQGIQEPETSETKQKKKKEKKKRKKFWNRKKNENPEQEEHAFAEGAEAQDQQEDLSGQLIWEPEETSGDDRNRTDDLLGYGQTDIPNNLFAEEQSDVSGTLFDEGQFDMSGDFSGEGKFDIPDDFFVEEGSGMPENLLGEEEAEILEKEQTAKEKKQGFFSRMMEFLTKEFDDDTEAAEKEKPEENATGENAEILKELDSEKKKKAKKDKNAKKDKKGKKGKEEDQPSGEETEGEEAAESGKTEKKTREKKLKKEKEAFKKEPAILSTRVRLGLIAFCATVTAAIIFLSIFLPEHADRLAAREAYYQGDYETAYQELNNQHLGASDALIYHRSETILSLQKKLTSYENRMALGQRVEALDALFRGVELYDQLIVEDTYGVAEELTGIYQSICGILEEEYGVSAQEAAEINTYDAQAYTRKLYSLINGTEFEMSHEEPQTEPEREPQADAERGPQTDAERGPQTDAEHEPQEEPDGAPEPLQDVLEAEEDLL